MNGSEENLGPLVSVVYWPGSGSTKVTTPLGIFDDDDQFIEDAPKIAKWICNSLGYPVMQVELTDIMIYSQIEQSVTEFSSLVNEFNMREQMLYLQGISTGSSISGMLVKSNPLPILVEMSRMYGTEAQSGGDVEYKSGYVTMHTGQQLYDLQSLWANVSESSNRIEIRSVFHERSPAIRRFFDPFAGVAGAGVGIENLLGEFGWQANYSIATQYLLMPMYETALRVQAIELNDQIRRSQFGFDIKDNKIRLFPVPDDSMDNERLWFHYTVIKEKFDNLIGSPGYVSGSSSGSSGSGSGGVASDYANVPYGNIMYSNINDVGKRWIRKYALALCKIMLGNIRNKYGSIPIPNSEIVLNGPELISQGQKEMEELVEQLRETLIETGRTAQMTKVAQNEENSNKTLGLVPNLIFIG